MGTLVNAIAVVAGSLIGLLIRRGLPERVEGAAMKLLGLSVLIIGFNGVVTSMVTVGADGSLSSDGSLLLIASLVIGGHSDLVCSFPRCQSRFIRVGLPCLRGFCPRSFRTHCLAESAWLAMRLSSVSGSIFSSLPPSAPQICSPLWPFRWPGSCFAPVRD